MTSVYDWFGGILTEGVRFGIEFEYEHGDILPPVGNQPPWRFVGDGSLRNNGMEAVSPPMTYAEAQRQVPRFYRWYRRYSWESTVRTSTHVHVNVSDRDMDELPGLFAAYALIEPVLFAYCGDAREENTYCVPWYRAWDDPQHLADIFQQGRWNGVTTTCKYSAFYVEPLARFHTVEFRHAPLFETPSEVLVWLKICEAVRNYGVSRTPEEVMRDYMRGTPDEWVRSVLGPFANRIPLLPHQTFERLIDDAGSDDIASLFVPCTYNTALWDLPVVPVRGYGTRDYHALGTGGFIDPDLLYHPEPDEYDPDYDPELDDLDDDL